MLIIFLLYWYSVTEANSYQLWKLKYVVNVK